MEKLFMCNLLYYINNGDVYEYQRFGAFQTLATSYPTLKWSGKSLIAYLDNIIKKANSYIPNIYYLNSNFQVYGSTAYITTFRNDYLSPSITTVGNFSANLFNSSHIKIDYKQFIHYYSDNTTIQKDCYYFAFRTTQKPTAYLYFFVCGNSTSSGFKNG